MIGSIRSEARRTANARRSVTGRGWTDGRGAEVGEVGKGGKPHAEATGQADRSAMGSVPTRGWLALGRAEAGNGSHDAGRGVQQYLLLQGRPTRAGGTRVRGIKDRPVVCDL